jgi:hypothetical protein
MENSFVQGEEFAMNGTVIFPADLNRENILKFTFLILENFSTFHKENMEIQIRNCYEEKGIEWQIKTFYYDNGFCLDRTYTFFLLPNWTLASFYEHWMENEQFPKCHPLAYDDKTDVNLGAQIKNFLQDLTGYYKKVGKVTSSSRFLNTANWKVIYAKSNNNGQTNVAERRIQEYFKFIKKPILNFKD